MSPAMRSTDDMKKGADEGAQRAEELASKLEALKASPERRGSARNFVFVYRLPRVRYGSRVVSTLCVGGPAHAEGSRSGFAGEGPGAVCVVLVGWFLTNDFREAEKTQLEQELAQHKSPVCRDLADDSGKRIQYIVLLRGVLQV